ncbi:TM2 domain-containing protein [Paenibacillus sp. Marseille-P2973]|uniref:NINE protein n=1 Tax=Paenibacillus sp. Marseille-P2973 TaxID=1871032 RepID=UPI001FFD7C74|nr:TM2 domain-containing protein [Paenibacillus sp. Marseille-P2973]
MNSTMNISKQTLSTTELLILSSEMSKQEKSLTLAYLMLLAGHLGVHRFYLKRPLSGTIQLVLFALTMVCYFVFAIMSAFESEVYSDGLGMSIVFLVLTLLMGLALTIWVIVDACILPGMVKSWNAKLEQSLIDQIVAYRSNAAFAQPK